MKKFKKVLAATVAASMLISMAGCGGTSSDTAEATTESTASADGGSEEVPADLTSNEGILIWATNAEFPPYEYHEGDAVVGIDAEIADYIGEQLGLEVQCEDMAFDSIIPAVVSGKADLGIAGMTVDPDRLENVNFSDPYVNAGQVIIVAEGSDIASADDLAGKTIGVQLGTTGDQYVTENITDATVERYNKGFEAVQAVQQGKVDAVVIDGEPAKQFVASAEGTMILDEPLTEEEYAIAVSKDNEALLEEVNRILAEMQENGKMAEITNKYLGDDAVSTDEASAEEGSDEAVETTTAA